MNSRFVAKSLVLLALALLLCRNAEGRTLKTTSATFANAVRAEVSGIVFTNLRGDKNALRNELKLKILEHKAGQAIDNLRMNVNAIISNVLVGDKSNIDVIVDVLMGNRAIIDSVTANLEAFAVNQINGSKVESATELVIDAMSNSNFITNLKYNLTGLSYNDINGDKNRADAYLAVTYAKNSRIGLGNELAEQADEATNSSAFGLPDVEMILDAILVNEVVSGEDNFLDNVLNMAAFNGAKIENMLATIEGILVNKVEGFKNDLFNVMDIAVAECRGMKRRKCYQQYASIDISSILLNDVIGDNNFIDNLITVVGAAAKIKGENVDNFIDTEAAEDLTDALIGALISVEAIVVNTLKPDGLLDNLPEAFGTEITNKMNLEFFKDATLGQIETLITGIISNDVLGRKNKLDNLLEIKLGNFVDTD